MRPAALHVKRVVTTMIVAFLLAQGWAWAHEGETHEMRHKGDEQMQKLHHIMPMYAQAQAKINEALAKKDAETTKAETEKILATITDLKKAKPHKNLKEIEAFRKIAAAFAGDVKKTAVLAKNGDFVGATGAFQSAQGRCNECHAKFR